MRRHREILFAFERVIHVDVGYRYRDSVPTGGLALCLFVDGPKLSRRQHKAHELAPPRFAGLPIDVICGDFFLHCRAPAAPQRLRMVRPLAGGAAIDTGNGSPGTLGVVLEHEGGGLGALTADHVVEASPAVFQPPSGNQQVGQVVDSDASLRAAVINVSGSPADVGRFLGIPQPLTGVATDIMALVAARTPVWKSGERTGVTRGFVAGFDDSVVRIGAASSGGPPEVACGGDSGSIWITHDGRGVGLYYGGIQNGGSEATIGFAQSLGPILDRFSLRV